ncbi:MAG: ATP-binding cassette domain-containing protein, partial [Nitriliruptorales bacterium]|nr:ATP-binding cassette domain-containing protein [Nitriliruptorales bacterium]
LGLARTFQIMRPFVGLSVRDNVAVAAHYSKRTHARGMARARDKADEVLEWVGLAPRGNADVTSLTTGERKKLELCRALAMDPTLLLLDEVMAGLNPAEVAETMELIRRVNGLGVTIALIEHLMKAVMGLCDRILVLHNGARIALGTPDEVGRDPAVIEAYLGSRYAQSQPAVGHDDDRDHAP